MVIESIEDAKKYMDEIQKHLGELTLLSKDAGMNTHAAMWLTIRAAFYDSPDEVETITDMFKIYLDHKIERDIHQGK